MKVARHEKIIELIRQYDIDTQEELAARLNEAGFKVTQATVSRDIRALKMTKVAGKDGKSHYAILSGSSAELGDKYTRVLHDALTSIDVGQNMIVIRTVPGMAMGVAAALDAFRRKGAQKGIRPILGFFIAGVAMGVLTYLDITGLLLYLPILSVFALETVEE